MDYDEAISKIHGALTSFNLHTPVSGKLRVLKQIFDKADDIDKHRMILFMILNSGTMVQAELSNDLDLGLITGICPNITLSELSYFLLTLKLTKFMSMVIISWPFKLTSELLDCILNDFHADDVLTGISDLIVAVFQKIKKVSTNDLFDDVSCIMPCFQRYVDKLWTLFNSDNFPSLMDYTLRIYLSCLKIYNMKDNIKDRDYCCNDSFDIVSECLISKSGDSELQRLDNDWLVCFLEDFNNKFSSICFSYLDVPELYEEVLRSSSVSDCVFEIRDEILKAGAETDLLNKRLSCLMRSHVPEAFDVDSVILRLRESGYGESKAIFKDLIQFSSAFHREETFNYIKDHLYLGDEEDLKVAFKTLKKEMKEEHTNQLQELMISCLERMTLNEQLRCLNEYFADTLSFMLEPENFDERLLESFNKFSDVDGSIQTCLISFCIQSPLKTIGKICRQGLMSPMQASTAADHLKMLKSACLATAREDCLNNLNAVLKALFESGDLTHKEKQCLTKMITKLHREKLLDTNFFEVCLLGNIEREVGNANWGEAVYLLDVLRSLVKTKMFHCKEIALLAFMSQLLDHASWDCCSFSTQLADAREIIISVIIYVLRKGRLNNEAEVAWLRLKITSCWEVNRFYFCDLWYSRGLDFPASEDLYERLLLLLHTSSQVEPVIDSIISRLPSMKFQDLKISLTSALLKVLPVLIRQEWTKLFVRVESILTMWLKWKENHADFNTKVETCIMLATGLHCMARVASHRIEIVPCFEFCLRNFGRTIHQIFLTGDAIEPGVCLELVKGVLFILNGIQCLDIRRANALALSPVVFALMDTAKKGETAIDEVERLEDWFKTGFI